jgi:DNA-binding MarR family transcriptional regulator
MTKTVAQTNQELAYKLSNNLLRLLKEFSKDFESRILAELHRSGHPLIRASHSAVFSNLGLGAVRVTELAKRAKVTQQAMGKMLKELEHIGYISRDVDETDKRAREIRLTSAGINLVAESLRAFEDMLAQYAAKIGEQELHDLERALRSAVAKLELNYLPESWVENTLPPR